MREVERMGSNEPDVIYLGVEASATEELQP
jgi:hypothetical protein